VLILDQEHSLRYTRKSHYRAYRPWLQD